MRKNFVLMVLTFMFFMALPYTCKAEVTYCNSLDDYIDCGNGCSLSEKFYGLDYFSAYELITSEYESTIPDLVKQDDTDEGVNYIIKNGYPNKNIVDDWVADASLPETLDFDDDLSPIEQVNYALTQVAILLYLNDEGYINNSNYFNSYYEELFDSYKQLPEEIKSIIDKLVADAKEYKENYISEIMVSNPNQTLTLSSDGKYYQTDYIKVNLSDMISYKVELTNQPSGIIVDKNGNEKSSFKANEEFQIKVPASKINSESVRVKIKAEIEKNNYTVYKAVREGIMENASRYGMGLDDGYFNLIMNQLCVDQYTLENDLFFNVKTSDVVKVPATGMNSSIILFTIGVGVIVIAIITIYFITKNRKASN